MSDLFDDSPFGDLFNEDEGETTTAAARPTQLGHLPDLPPSSRAESGFVGLMNQFISLHFMKFFNSFI